MDRRDVAVVVVAPVEHATVFADRRRREQVADRVEGALQGVRRGGGGGADPVAVDAVAPIARLQTEHICGRRERGAGVGDVGRLALGAVDAREAAVGSVVRLGDEAQRVLQPARRSLVGRSEVERVGRV